ncbi:MAG TPA: DUF998 domain-containing protein [Lacunisphaera sp.]|nr:DUF998 domain-containing protein [Lacunisphaera sp.]
MMPILRRQGAIVLCAGLAGGPLFLCSLAVFGALTPGYSHWHQAVSRLGAWGMPWGLWFDLFGLLLPGLSAVGVALELRRQLRALQADTRWATAMAGFGIMLAFTAVPADFHNMFRSAWTWVHAFFVLGNGLVWLVVIPGCTQVLRTLGATRAAATMFFALGYLTAAEFLLYGLLPHAPGLVQRLMILTTHAAVAWMSWTMLHLPQPRRAPTDSRRPADSRSGG